VSKETTRQQNERSEFWLSVLLAEPYLNEQWEREKFFPVANKWHFILSAFFLGFVFICRFQHFSGKIMPFIKK
jgi:hypothetical protein